MKSISVWQDLNDIKEYPILSENKEVDVLIIGGGLTGISTIYHLRDSNLKVMLVEQNKIGMAVTGKSTGKLSYLQNDLIDKIRNGLGNDIALKYIKSQISTIENIKKVIKKEKINCDLEEVDSYLYTNNNSEISKLKALKDFLNSNGIICEEDNKYVVKSKYMFKVKNTYVFHPIKFVYGLLKNNKYPIFENTSIKNIKKEDNYYICYTNSCKIKAKWVVMASHYPHFIFPYLFPLKANLEKSYISCSKYNGSPISLISYSNPFISLRTYQNNLLYLSNSHSINIDVCDKDNFNELLKKVHDLKLEPDYIWSNIDVMTSDGLPYIGKIKDRLLIGTGYNTWGLTNGFLAGKILSDIIVGNNNEYVDLFSPKRKNIKQFIGGFLNTYKTISGLVNGSLNKSDKNLKCPHVGCGLIYNEIEKTWDCPCHGSRFDNNGKCISGPANKDIDIKQ